MKRSKTSCSPFHPPTVKVTKHLRQNSPQGGYAAHNSSPVLQHSTVERLLKKHSLVSTANDRKSLFMRFRRKRCCAWQVGIQNHSDCSRPSIATLSVFDTRNRNQLSSCNDSHCFRWHIAQVLQVGYTKKTVWIGGYVSSHTSKPGISILRVP